MGFKENEMEYDRDTAVAMAFQLAARVCTDASDAHVAAMAMVSRTHPLQEMAGMAGEAAVLAQRIAALTPADARQAFDTAIERAKEDGRVEESFTLDKKNKRFQEMLAQARADGLAGAAEGFFNPDGLCGLCGNYGVVDTRGRITSGAGVVCGVRAFCICLNGRAWKEADADLARLQVAKAAEAVKSKSADLNKLEWQTLAYIGRGPCNEFDARSSFGGAWVSRLLDIGFVARIRDTRLITATDTGQQRLEEGWSESDDK